MSMALFIPFAMTQRITDVSVDFLKKHHIRALLLDADNTLSTHFSQEPLPNVREWIACMKNAGIGMFVVSNARASRVAPFAEKLGLEFFSMCKKPLPFAVKRAICSLGLKSKEVLLCGDQLFTDMLCAHIIGVRGLLVRPAKPEDKLSFKIRRSLEKPLVKGYLKKDGIIFDT